jgi:hypothetical protein
MLYDYWGCVPLIPLFGSRKGHGTRLRRVEIRLMTWLSVNLGEVRTVSYILQAMMCRVERERSIWGDRARGAKIGPSEDRLTGREVWGG